MDHKILFWIGFHLLLAILLVLDWFFFHRKEQSIPFKKACFFSGFWIVLALSFNFFIYLSLGADKALEFFTGYLIEKSLSVDNLFLFLLIFTHFRVPDRYQHKILSWGILGAIILRITLILLGIQLIQTVHWMFYVFGGFLVLSALKLLAQRMQTKDPFKGFFYRLIHKILPIAKSTKELSNGQFFIKQGTKYKVTPLLITLLMIESTDIVFALDSIPAIFAITQDPYIVYTSNIFAILGLRALYFLLAPSLQKLRFIKVGLALILLFVGAKMLLEGVVVVSVLVSLGVIVVILLATILISYNKKIFNHRDHRAHRDSEERKKKK